MLFGSSSKEDVRFWNETVGGQRTSSGVNVSEASALYFSAYFCAMAIISGDEATLPLHAYRRVSDDQRRRENGHWVEDALNIEPNQDGITDAISFRETMTIHALGWGNGYAEIERTGAKPFALHILHPSRVKVVQTKSGQLAYEVRNSSGTPDMVPPERMFHLRGPGGDGLTGWSIARLARETIGLALAAEQYGSGWFGNGARPGGVLKHPHRLSKTAADRIRESWKNLHAGPEHAHEIAVLEEGMEFQALGIPPEDSQFLECVVPETLLTLADGTLKRADQIAAGDRVLGWDYETSSLVPSTVRSVGDSGSHPLVRIRTHRGRDLVTTLNHPYLASRRLRCQKCSRVHGPKTPGGLRPEWVFAGDLQVGDYVAVQHAAQWEGTGELSFGDGYFVGCMVGDGSIRRKGALAFSNADPEVIAAVNEQASKFGSRLKHKFAYDYEFVGGSQIGRPRRGTVANPTREFFRKLGLVGTDSYTKRIPGAVMRSGPAAVAGFISGYLDTDGCVVRESAKQPKVTWTSASLGLIQDLQHCLSLLGVQGHLCVHRPEDSRLAIRYELHVCGRANVETLATHLHLCHPKKRERLAYWGSQTDHPREKPDFQRYDRVVSIEPLPDGRTIAIEVEGTHSHVTNGIVTHNTRLFQIREIARWFKIPSRFLGDPEGESYASAEMLELFYLNRCLRYWLVRWERAIQRSLILRSERGKIYVEHQTEALLKADLKARYEAYRVAREGGWMSANDVLRRENMNPIGEKGDIYLVPKNFGSAEHLLEHGDWDTGEEEENADGVSATGEEGLAAGRAGGVEEVQHDGAGHDRGDGVVSEVAEAARPDDVVRGRGGLHAQGEESAETKPQTVPEAVVTAHRALLADALGRMLRKEVANIRQAAKKPGEFLEWLEGYYPHHEELLMAAVGPVLEAWHAVTGRRDALAPAALAVEHCHASRTLLLEVAGSATPAQFPAAVEACVAGWEKRAQETADNVIPSEVV